MNCGSHYVIEPRVNRARRPIEVERKESLGIEEEFLRSLPRGSLPLLSFALQNAAKSDSETMISRGSNPLRTPFDILANMHQENGSEEPVS